MSDNLVERLRAEAGMYGYGQDQPQSLLREAASTIEALRDDLKRANELINAAVDDYNAEKTKGEALREALRPFAEFAPYVEMFIEGRAANGGSPVLPTKHFRKADFDRARTALSPGSTEGTNG